MELTNLPKSLHEAILFYSDPEVCHEYMIAVRWPNGVVCPHCGCFGAGFVATRKIWNCKDCGKQFSVKVGTVFEHSRICLTKWLPAVWLLVNAKNGISSCELARSLGVTQKTAWFMEHRIRHMLKTGSFEMKGTIEADETYVGGKAKNMHYEKKKEKITGRGASGKTVVFGLVQRGNGAKDENGVPRKKEDRIYSQVQLSVVPDTGEETLIPAIKERVQPGSEVFTDAHKSYRRLTAEGFKHDWVDHAIRYVEGRVYTNGCENVWTLLDRMLDGTYVSCLPHHLTRYADELEFRFNQRGGTDLTRFVQATKQAGGKRLTYQQLTQEHLRYLAP